MGRPSRRELLAAVAASAASAGAPAQAAERPNILFIMADDLGYADLSCYGRRDYRTPRIDRLAAEGLLLTQAYANSPVCSATRAALITGRYQYRLPVGLYEPIRSPRQDAGLPARLPTLPEQLRRAGYRTSLIGKWHLGELPAHGPLRAGYQRFFGVPGGSSDYFTHLAEPKGPASTFDGLWEGELRAERPGYLTDLLGDRAVAEIGEYARGGPPFFISLHFTAPHWPWEGPADEAVSKTLARLQHLDGGSLATYAAMVGSLDDNVGKVLAALDRGGLSRNTLVVITSDNGGERYSDVWPLVGGKGELLEGGIRVPALVRWPGQIAPGRRSDQVSITMDWLPTLLAAARTAPDPAFPSDGEDLLSVLRGGAPPRPRQLFWRFNTADQAAVREGDWKYLKLGTKEALFNLTNDVRERANLKELHPALFARLKSEFAAWNAGMLPYVTGDAGADAKSLFSDRY